MRSDRPLFNLDLEGRGRFWREKPGPEMERGAWQGTQHSRGLQRSVVASWLGKIRGLHTSGPLPLTRNV